MLHNEVKINNLKVSTVGPDITVSEVAVPDIVVREGIVEYSITLENNGGEDALGLSITGILPAGFIYQAGSTSGAATTNPSIDGQRLTWGGPFVVLAGNSLTLRFQAKAPNTLGTYMSAAETSGANVSLTQLSDAAKVEVVAPQIQVIINNNDEYTNNRKVKVTLNYPDNTTKVRLSNFPFRKESRIPRWQNPEQELDWTLSGFLGESTVYAQFKFDDGTTSEIYSDSIIYDRTRPLGMVIINGGASSTNTSNVTVKVKITAIDFESSVDQMQVSNSLNFSGADWQPYQEEFNWQLESLEGNRPQVRRVYVRLKDKAGNISSLLRGFILLTP